MTRWIFLLLIILAPAGASHGDDAVTVYDAPDRLWRVTEIDNQPFDATATLSFPEPGRIAGQAPCNRYTAAMATPFPEFAAGPIAATRMFCPLMPDETRFLETLATVTHADLRDNTLILSAPDGRTITLISDD